VAADFQLAPPRLPAKKNWRARAACLNCPPDLFFPGDRSEVAEQRIEEAKRVCRSCEVSDECLAYALKTEQAFGIWGGTDPKDRDRIRRRQRVFSLVAPSTRVDCFTGTRGTH
jgi:WhiB family redox-sensing transcriptional regulator